MQKNTTELRNELSYARDRRYDNIDITNDVMFATVMQQPDICIGLLENMFPGRKICGISFVDSDGESSETFEAAENNAEKTTVAQPDIQKTLAAVFGKRGVRMDVYLDDGKTIYDVEMQTASSKYLAKRSRHYGSEADISQLERGQTYENMKPVYIIFICTFDPFGEGLYQYTFQNTCQENRNLDLHDGAYKIFFNTSGTTGDISDGMRQLLEYMNNTKDYPLDNSKNELIHKIDTAVAYAKISDKWRRQFMKYEADMMEARLNGEEAGREQGIALGEKRGIALGEKRGIALGREDLLDSLLKDGIITNEQASLYRNKIGNDNI